MATKDYSDLLANWSVKHEQNRADFIDWLYKYYGCTDGYYTGLFQRFVAELPDSYKDILSVELVK